MQDVVAVDILRNVKRANVTGQAARRNNGHFAFEMDEGLENGHLALHGCKCGVGIVRTQQLCLSLAIIAEPRCLQHSRQSGDGDGVVEFRAFRDGGEQSSFSAQVTCHGFLEQAVLSNFKRF